ncbi:MAG: hypothetical protein ACTTH5_07265 [Wolinella sp.]
MLLFFRAKNFRSFRDDLIIDMRALKITGSEQNKVIQGDTQVLKVRLFLAQMQRANQIS